MSTRLLGDSPHDYWDESKPPSPGQWEAIAKDALKLLAVPVPATRLNATVALARLRLARLRLARLRLAQGEVPPTTSGEVPEPW